MSIRRGRSAGGVWTAAPSLRDRKSTRLNSSHTEIYTLSLHDALPISGGDGMFQKAAGISAFNVYPAGAFGGRRLDGRPIASRSEEHTSELQSHRDLHSFPTRRSSDLRRRWNVPESRRYKRF